MSHPGVKAQRPPSALGTSGRLLWRKLVADFLFEDAAALELLEMACRAEDRAEEARLALARTGGAVIGDRFGKPVRNPAVMVERDAITVKLQCLKLLGVNEVGQKNKGGRPVGS